VTPFNWLAQAKEFRLDWHGLSSTDIHASRRRNWSSRWQRPLFMVWTARCSVGGLLAVEHFPILQGGHFEAEDDYCQRSATWTGMRP
jgi:hypothetical protein